MRCAGLWWTRTAEDCLFSFFFFFQTDDVCWLIVRVMESPGMLSWCCGCVSIRSGMTRLAEWLAG